MLAGKRHFPLTVQSVTVSVSLLDRNFPGYLDPKNLAHPALGALCLEQSTAAVLTACCENKLLGIFGSLC